MTPSGIEPATFRVVAQNFNHCAKAVPKAKSTHSKNVILFVFYTATMVERTHPSVTCALLVFFSFL
jgi:hypothetical protein